MLRLVVLLYMLLHDSIVSCLMIHEPVTSCSSNPELTDLMNNEGGSTLAEQGNNETGSNLLSYQSTLSQSQSSSVTIFILTLLFPHQMEIFMYVMLILNRKHTRKVLVAAVFNVLLLNNNISVFL